MQSYGRDFGDHVPATPATPGNSEDGGPTATRSPPDLPDIAPADIARAIRLSLAACGLMLSNDPALAGAPEGTTQTATIQNNVLALGAWYTNAPQPEQSRYSLRPASSI
ncbi:hypothetical protein EST38_g14597, partial [Candolleomyces aberdarensis]